MLVTIRILIVYRNIVIDFKGGFRGILKLIFKKNVFTYR